MKLINQLKEIVSLKNLIIITGIVAFFMLILYFVEFNDGFSDDFEKWGAFGSYFASITGLLAFLGVLYTVKQSNERANKAEEQSKGIEERGVFFTMLELYQKQVDNIVIEDLKGVNALKRYCQNLDGQLMINLIYKKFKDGKSFLKSKDPDELAIQKSILKAQDIPFSVPIFMLSINESYDNYSIEIPTDFDDNKNKYQYYIDDLFRHHKIDVSYKNLYELMRYTGKYIHINYNLGQYFRNVYYIMTMISKFDKSSYYSKIFRAQLSNYELTLLLYNALSVESNKEVVKMLIDFDMFNNIHNADVYLARYYGDINTDDYFEIIRNPKNDSFRDKIFVNKLINELLNEFLKDPMNVE